MKNQSRIIHFNSKEIEESNGIYGLIVKTVLEQKGIELDDLKPLYMNKVPGAKKSRWTSFKNTLLRVLEKGEEMSFSSFLNWSKLLNIKTTVSAVSFYGEDIENDFIFDTNFENDFVIESNYKNNGEKITFKVPDDTIHEDLEKLVEDDIEEKAERIKEFLDFILPLLSNQITYEQDENEVCNFLHDKISEGIKFLNIKYKISLSVGKGMLDDAKFFIVTILIEDKLVASTLIKKLQ